MDELDINSISRFKKRSPDLILETHGHCEIPAGCGGVILRWRDPREGTELWVWAWTLGTIKARLDGVEPSSTRWKVSEGQHTLALEVSGLGPADGFLFAAGDGPPATSHEETTARDRPPTFIRSTDDGSWRFTAQEPGAGWTDAAFDDGSWQPLSLLRLEEPDYQGGLWVYNRCIALGACGLGAQDGAERIWVRKQFEVHGA